MMNGQRMREMFAGPSKSRSEHERKEEDWSTEERSGEEVVDPDWPQSR